MPPRPRHRMPNFIRAALNERGLMDAYLSRPPYQRNDYIGWITRARLAATKEKRLNQMLEELKGGKLYMNMPVAIESVVRTEVSDFMTTT